MEGERLLECRIQLVLNVLGEGRDGEYQGAMD